MAAATTLIAGGLMAGGGLAKAFTGGRQMKTYDNMIQNYERQDLNNLAENLTISTYGSDLIKDQTARNTATIMGAIQQGGSRAIAGSVGNVVNMGVEANRVAGMDLDNQVQKRQYAIYEDGVRTRDMQERREESDLMGMGAMREAGRQDMWGGIGDVMQAGMYGMRAIEANRTTPPTTN